MKPDPTAPYDALPLLPPAMELESNTVLKAAIGAHAALAELKGIGQTIPNQNVLLGSISLQEARDSSEIENILTTTDELYRELATEQRSANPQSKEVVSYQRALWLGMETLERHPLLTTSLFEALVKTVTGNTAGVRSVPGVHLANADGEVLYTPPQGEVVIRQKLANLEAFLNLDDDRLDPLVKLAVAHYQFEAIHPFSDGNGRTGRILNILYLIHRGLLDQPVLYLSRYIIEHKNDYYQLLRAVTMEEAWEPWILYMLAAVEDTARFSKEKILAIQQLLESTVEQARAVLPRRVYSLELIQAIFREPYCKIQVLVDAGIAKRQAASEYLKALEEAGFLQSQQLGRERIFINQPLLHLLAERG